MRSLLTAALPLIALALAACGGSDPTPAPSSSAPAPEPSSTATVPRAVTGLFTDPRPTTPSANRPLGPRPTTFPPWNGESTMVYDIQTRSEIDLGEGSLGSFSPDSARMVWIASPTPFDGGEAWMIDLRTMEKRDLGPGRLAGFVDDDHVGVVYAARNDSYVIDLRTGDTRPDAGIPFYKMPYDTATAYGYTLRRAFGPEGPFPRSTFTVIDTGSGMPLLEVDAIAAVSAGSRTIAIATVSLPIGEPNPNGYQHGTTNVFLVDIATGTATFIATGDHFIQFALAAADGYVVWADNYCDGGKTRLYGRKTGTITEIDATLWPAFTPGGLIVDGAFGGSALIDPKTLQYVATIPQQGDSSWSPDYRYASLGISGGHGGLCL
jgi:hypothetical protein